MKKRKRPSGTKKCNSPFKIRGVSFANDKWKVEVICGLHNHPLSDTIIGHSYKGRLKDGEQKSVEDLIKYKISIPSILALEIWRY